MEFKVHIEDHRDLMLGATLAAVGIACLALAKRGVEKRLNKMKTDIIDEIRKWH